MIVARERCDWWPLPVGVVGGETVPVEDTTIKRNGRASAKCEAGKKSYVEIRPPVAVDRYQYFRTAVYVTAKPVGSNEAVLRLVDETGNIMEVFFRTNGKFSCYNSYKGKTFGEESPEASLNTWYIVEVKIKVKSSEEPNSTIIVRVLKDNGETFLAEQTATGEAAYTRKKGVYRARAGRNGTSTSAVVYVDDIGMNDETGTKNNSWIGATTPTIPTKEKLACYQGATMDGAVALMEGEAERTDAPYNATTWARYEEHQKKHCAIVAITDPWKSKAEGGPAWDGYGAGASTSVYNAHAIPFKGLGSPPGEGGAEYEGPQVVKDVIAGRWDSYLKTYFTKAKEFAHPFFFRLWWEMNGDWWNWSPPHATAAEFVEAWQHIYNIAQEQGATNATFVWCPNIIYGAEDPEAWYPGDSYVHWTGMDAYNGEHPQKRQRWQSPMALLRPTYERLLEIAPEKPIMIGELGSSEYWKYTDAELHDENKNPGKKAAWLKELLEQMPTECPAIRALAYFNWNIEHSGVRVDWPIESYPDTEPASTVTRDSYAEGLASSYYLYPNSHTLTDLAAIPSPAAPILNEDSRSGAVTINGTKSESWSRLSSYADSGTIIMSLSGTKSESWTGPEPSLDVRVTREFVPDRLAIEIVPPAAPRSRWAEDGGAATATYADLTLGDEMPGGDKESGVTLTRDPQRSWSDQQVYGDIRIYGPGGTPRWEGYFDKSPGVSGEQVSVNGEATGNQGILTDNEAVNVGFINTDISNFGDPSGQRLEDTKAAFRNDQVDVTVGYQDAGTAEPGVYLKWSRLGEGKVGCEVWWYGDGVLIGGVILDFHGSGEDAAWLDSFGLSDDDLATNFDPSPDYNAVASSLGQGVWAEGARRYVYLQSWRDQGLAELPTYTGVHSFRNIAVIGAPMLPLTGTWPEQGYTAAQMLAYLISNYAAPLTVNAEDLDDSGDILRQAWYPRTPLAEIVRDLLKYSRYDWYVRGKRFYVKKPGTYGRKWKALVAPSNLNEVGKDGERLWKDIVLVFSEPGGRMRMAGPPGSGYEIEDERLAITDPQHPAILAGRTRRDKLEISVPMSPEVALSVGERFLAESVQLDHSGSATHTGYVMDDHGVYWPASCMRSGDEVSYMDAHDASYRRIVRRNYTHSERAAEIDLDAPPSGLEALQEQLQAVLIPLAIG